MNGAENLITGIASIIIYFLLTTFFGLATNKDDSNIDLVFVGAWICGGILFMWIVIAWSSGAEFPF